VLFGSPPWDSAVYWALDLETSGLAAERDEILSVGMVPVRGGVIRYGERLYRLVRPRDLAGLSVEGIRAHHILPSELAAAAPLEEVLPEIDVRLREGVLVLHQAAVDLGFLRRAYRRAGLGWPRPRVVDTVRLVVKWQHRRQRFEPHPKPFSASLPGARSALGLPAYPHHHALWDALATAELMLALRDRLGARRVSELR
jgi:DNA polymerase-3 subunit epsilon